MNTSQKAILAMRKQNLSRENELHLGREPERPKQLDPKNLKDALEQMRNPERFRTLKYCKLVTQANKREAKTIATDEGIVTRPGCCPEIKRFEKAFVKRMAVLGVPVYCSCMFRTRAQQIELYVTGQSPDMPGHSAHELGQACDLVHADYGKELPKLCWDIFGRVGEEIAISQQSGVIWGGPLRPEHWEIL